MALDRTKIDKFVGMLGSEHDGERLNALRFIHKLAVENRLTMVEFFSQAYGGGAERIVYKEKIVYRDAPPKKPSGTPFDEAFRTHQQRQKDDPGYRARSKAEEDAWEQRKRREEAERAREDAEQMRNATYGFHPKSKAYGHNGSMTSKIRTVLSYHSSNLTDWEKEFLEGLINKLDTGYEMSPKQRASYAKIMDKVGM